MLENKTNEELYKMILDLKMQHEALKQKLLKGYDELELIEKKFYEVNNELKKRLGNAE